MPLIQQLFRDSDFDATCWWLDWLEDPDRSPNRVAPNCPVADDIPGQRRSARRVGTLRRDFPYVNAEGRHDIGAGEIDAAVAVLWRTWALMLAVVLLGWLIT